MENRYIINYDIKKKLIINESFKQGDVDSSILEFHLLNNKSPIDITGETIELIFVKYDNIVVLQDINSGVTIKDPINGIFECLLKRNTLSIVGPVKCEIKRSISGKVLTTRSFIFNVVSSIK